MNLTTGIERKSFKPRSMHIFDPGLKNIAGHNLTQDLAIARDCQTKNIPVTIYNCHQSNIDIEDVKIIEKFRLDILAEATPQKQEFAVLESYFLINRIFYQDLCSFPNDFFSSDDLIYFSSITHNQLEAVADWILSLPNNKRPHIAITLRYLNSKMLYNTNRGYGPAIDLLYSHVLPKLIERHPNTYLFSDTQILSDNYTRMSGTPVVTLPIPQSTNTPNYAPRQFSGKNINLLYIGSWSQYHGSDFIPHVIKSILNDFQNVTFTIQVNTNSNDLQIMANIEKQFLPRVKILFGSLSTEIYTSTLDSADVVLLLYLPSHYSFASSGVFTEAAALGKVLVITAGTTLETSAKNFNLGAVVVPEFTIESCCEAVRSAIVNHQQLKKMADDSYITFCNENSPNGFLTRMFEHIESKNAICN